jgi:hypothetical protein
MRFAWLHKQPDYSGTAQPGCLNQFVFSTYNLIYWIPAVLLVVGTLDYEPAFAAFTLINVVRALINAYRVNVLSPAQAIFFPLRAP